MAVKTVTIDNDMVRKLLPKREPGAHKWRIGGVLVVAGSPLYPGAAWLASRSAGRAGAGIVLLASGRGVISSIAASIPEVAHVILPESDTHSGAKRTHELITERLARVKSVVVGPGLGDDDAAEALLGVLFGKERAPVKSREVIGFGLRIHPLGSNSNGDKDKAKEKTFEVGAAFADGSMPVVIDADALNWLSTQPEWWEDFPTGRAILTPHVGELSRLLDIETDEILKDPQKHAENAASTWNQIVVLKSGRTLATDGKRTLIAEHESPALATAGSGDVFAGAIGAFLAQGLEPLDAAAAAIQLGTIAATALASEFGETGVIATDLPDAMARAAQSLAV